MADILPCTVRQVPKGQRLKAAQTAVRVNPNNHPGAGRVAALSAGPLSPARLALIVSRRWPAAGVRLTTKFMDNPPAELRQRILSHLNAWAARANVEFVETRGAAQVRIARWGGDWGGYWSYLGTDVLLIPADEPTMNLEGFTTDTPESEFVRVVRHEAGHTLGFPHEHMRRTLVRRLNEKKVIEYFMATQGWSEEEVRRQVLTPLEAVTLKRSYRVDERSIMAYRIPGALTKSGRPIAGGSDITETDHKFAASVYPRVA